MARTAEEQAGEILSCYFGLQRVVFGSEVALAHMDFCGWTSSDRAQLTRIMAEGCHNLSELAGGHWGPRGVVSTHEEVRSGLERECRWLYEHVETLHYPASWAEHYEFFGRWKAFWDEVAAVLKFPPKYGTPFARPESRQQLGNAS